MPALGSEAYIAGTSLLRQVGLEESDVTWVPAGGGEGIGKAMTAGQIDIMLAEDTAAIYATQILRIGRPLVDLKTAGMYADWFGNGAWALESQLKATPADYQAFADAIADAVDWISDPANQAGARAIYRKYSPTSSDATIDAVTADSADYFGTTARCSGLENIAEWLIETKQIDRGNGPGSCTDMAWKTAKLA